jgi:nitrate reductase NapE component
MSVALSVLLGALLSGVNGAAALLVIRRAKRLAPDAALRLVLATMTVRMSIVLAVFSLVVGLMPVHEPAFVGAFGLLFVAALVAEVLLAMGRSAGSPRPTVADA